MSTKKDLPLEKMQRLAGALLILHLSENPETLPPEQGYLDKLLRISGWTPEERGLLPRIITFGSLTEITGQYLLEQGK